MQEYWIDVDAVDKFKEWLKSHESDIASEINDFGDLKDIFSEMLGWEAGGDKYADEM